MLHKNYIFIMCQLRVCNNDRYVYFINEYNHNLTLTPETCHPHQHVGNILFEIVHNFGKIYIVDLLSFRRLISFACVDSLDCITRLNSPKVTNRYQGVPYIHFIFCKNREISILCLKPIIQYKIVHPLTNKFSCCTFFLLCYL